MTHINDENLRLLAKMALPVCCFLFISVALVFAQGSPPFGEVRFDGGSSMDRLSGVWIDGTYVGLLKELHGSKNVLLPAGQHEISVRQPGYEDSTMTILLEPTEVLTVQVNMRPSPPVQALDISSSLNLRVRPGRAAVLVDDKYLGQASQFGAPPRSMPLVPGKHRIKIESPGYRTFETEVTLAAGQTSELKTHLIKAAAAEDSSR